MLHMSRREKEGRLEEGEESRMEEEGGARRGRTARPRKGTTRRQGRLGSCFPHGGEYDCTRVYWFVCCRRRIIACVGESRDG